MAIDGLIIIDNTGRPIIQSGFRSTSSAYPLVHVDALNNALAKAARPSDVNPVLHIPAYDTTRGPSACCHVSYGDVRILCPISGNVDPLLGFSFLQTFVDILHDYFGSVSAATLKDNFDIVYQLLEEMLDSDGQPLTTSPNALREIVLPPSLLSKLLSATNITPSLNSSTGSAGVFASPIPWRKANVKYSSNELYFDIVEEMDAVVNRYGTVLSSIVWGRIESNAKLTGTPDLLMTFKNPQVLTDCSFHPCVRLARWSSQKALSFVPPDGKFILMEYRYSHGMSAASGVASLVQHTNTVPVPLTIKSSLEIEQNTATLDVSLTPVFSKNVASLRDVVLELYLGDDLGISSVRCEVSRGSGGFGSTGNGGEDGPGAWSYSPKTRILRWEIGSAESTATWVLKGWWTVTPDTTPRPARALQVTFITPKSTFSALKVDQLKVNVEGYKPFKGVRGRSMGKVEWRI